MTYEQARQAREQLEARLAAALEGCPSERTGPYAWEASEAGRHADALSAQLARAIHVEYHAKR